MIVESINFAGDYRVAEIRFRNEDNTIFQEARGPGCDISDLPEWFQLAIMEQWTPEVVAAYADFTKEVPSTEKRLVLKSVIVSRLIAAGKIGAAKAALDANPAAFARWFASDRPAINHDDPDALALLKAIGADSDVILAP